MTLMLTCLLVVAGSASAFETNGGTCDDAITMPLNASVRSYGDSRNQFYTLEIPAAGLVTVDVAVPGPAGDAAKLGLFSHGCGGTSSGNFVVIEHTPTGMVLMTDAPSTYVFAVAAQDPRSSLGEYKFTAGYAAARIETASPGADDEGEDPEETEDEPNRKEDEPDPTRPNLPSMLEELAPMSRELCRQLAIDDHGDTALCATGIRPGQNTRGRIVNSWADDHDLFAFTLRKTQTVELQAGGAADTLGVLYDQHGHQLASNDDSDRRGGFRIVKTLNAGRYFVRVEGSHGAEGTYTLNLRAQAW